MDPVEPAAGEAASTDLTADTLDDLRRCLEASVAELTATSEPRGRAPGPPSGRPPVDDIVIAEERPLVVERITHVLDELGEAGGRFRRGGAGPAAGGGEPEPHRSAVRGQPSAGVGAGQGEAAA